MPALLTCLLLAASSERCGRVVCEIMLLFTFIAYLAWNFAIDGVCRWANESGYAAYSQILLVAIGFSAATAAAWGCIMGCLLMVYAAHCAGARRLGSPVATMSGWCVAIAGGVIVVTGTTVLLAVPHWTSRGLSADSVGTRHLLIYVGYVAAIVAIGLVTRAARLVYRSLVAARASAIELYTAAENMEHTAAVGHRGYAGV